MAKNQIRIFFIKKYTKSSKKRAFVRELRFKGKKPQGLCALCFVLKRAFNNTIPITPSTIESTTPRLNTTHHNPQQPTDQPQLNKTQPNKTHDNTTDQQPITTDPKTH